DKFVIGHFTFVICYLKEAGARAPSQPANYSKLMRICRFKTSGVSTAHFGVLEGESILPLPEDIQLGASIQSSVALSKALLLAPVTPSKVVCVGRNYVEHAAELGNKMPDEPLLFLKAPSAIIGDGDHIDLPTQSKQVEHEGELGVVIGKIAHNIRDDENPLSYVLGYTCVNDVTARDLQRKDVQFTRGKSFDSFCPVGPTIVTDLLPDNLTVTTRVNGVVKQNGNTADMAFPVPFLIRYISNIMTLNPGDLIATGTPAGVSAIKHGDVVEVEVSGIGVLRNPVRTKTS
ncbi:MAG TPA: fumarylacetoacetate hydrolase family protein, partial [Pyrinomonadaceae bacterium]